MSHLGIVVALRDEASPLTASKPPLRTPIALAGQVSLVVSGMGADNALAAAGQLRQAGATALMSFGTAAGLDARLQSGDLILADQLVDGQGDRHRVDADWAGRLQACLTPALTVWRGGICQSHEVIASPADKAGLQARTGCLALDMESAALAGFARQQAMPFVSLRAVVDEAGMSLPASLLNALDADGEVSLKKLLPALLVRPADVLVMMKLARAFAAASRSLRRCRQLAGAGFLLQN